MWFKSSFGGVFAYKYLQENITLQKAESIGKKYNSKYTKPMMRLKKFPPELWKECLLTSSLSILRESAS